MESENVAPVKVAASDQFRPISLDFLKTGLLKVAQRKLTLLKLHSVNVQS